MPRFWSSAGVGPPGPSGEPGSGNGGTQTLDQVCDLGNTTDQDIKLQDAHLNYDGPDGDSHLYFYKGSATGRYLKWDDTGGYFVLNAALDISSQRITSLADPTDAQDAATKSYVDTVSGVATQDLDGVCDIGSTTDQIVTVAALRSDADLYVNYNGPNAEGSIFFYHDADPVYAWLSWDNIDTRFEFSESLQVGGNIEGSHVRANGSFFANYNGAQSSGELFFYTNADPYGAYLQWDESATMFKFSNALRVSGTILLNGDNIYINADGTGDSFVRFYDVDAVGEYSYLQWDKSEERHRFSHGLAVVGDFACNYQTVLALKMTGTQLWINYDGGESDCKIYFWEGGDLEGAFLRWNDSGVRFHLSHGLTLDTGSFVSAGDISTYEGLKLNIGAAANDTIINFSNTGDLRWNYSVGIFEFSDNASVLQDQDISYVGSAAGSEARFDFFFPDGAGRTRAGAVGAFTDGYNFGDFGGMTLVGNRASGVQIMAFHGSGAIKFHTGGYASANERMRILANGNIDVKTNKIVNVLDPTADQEAATKKYVDDNAGTPDTGPILIMNALWLDDDSGAPLTSLLSGEYSALHDGNKIIEAKYQASSNWAIGVDLGVTRDVARIKLFDDPADQNHPADTGSGWGGIYAGGNYDSLKVYTADVNGTWTYRETVHPVPRLPTAHGRPCTIDIALAATYSCRYIKLYCDLGQLAAVNGGAIGVAEIEAHYD